MKTTEIIMRADVSRAMSGEYCWVYSRCGESASLSIYLTGGYRLAQKDISRVKVPADRAKRRTKLRKIAEAIIADLEVEEADINYDDWKSYDASGYLQLSGVAVRRHPDDQQTCEIISIGAAMHRADELRISERRIDSLHGWYLVR